MQKPGLSEEDPGFAFVEITPRVSWISPRLAGMTSLVAHSIAGICTRSRDRVRFFHRDGAEPAVEIRRTSVP